MTVGLCLIVKDYDNALDEKIHKWSPYFDEIYVQVNGKGKAASNNAKVKFSKFKWNNNFSDARNALLKEVTTDFWMWVDDDDEIEGLENLKTVLRQMEDQKADSAMFLYHYAKNPMGEEIADHWKDRVMRTSHPWKWEGVIHENPHSRAYPTRLQSDLITINHVKEPEDYFASLQRNHSILEAEYEKGDPRITYYLARSHYTFQEYDRAIELFIEHIQTSGSVEDQYQSWMYVARAHQKLGNPEKAIKACNEAELLLPAWPDAYLLKGELYYGLDQMERCLEWFKVGLSKPTPKTLQMYDPSVRYRAIMLGALAELSLGHVQDAYELFLQVKKLSPEYGMVKKYGSLFETAVLEHHAIDKAKWLIQYLEKKGDPKKVYEALPGELAMDIRLNSVRNKLYPPKKWPKKSVVFFCGVSTGTWGADTLDKGMGGSEEAIVYLSRELGKLGWQVTIYNDRTEEYKDAFWPQEELWIDGVQKTFAPVYLPWNTFNSKDEFDVIVAWRMPEVLKGIKARKKLCDLHDVMDADAIKAASEWTDTFMCKSNYHRSLFPDVPDEKIVVVSNGILREQFHGN